MKSIEDKAKAYAEQYEERYQVAMFKAFLDGATEQKEIDIDKACEWLKTNNGKRFNGFEIVYTQGFIAEFRKAMED